MSKNAPEGLKCPSFSLQPALVLAQAEVKARLQVPWL